MERVKLNVGDTAWVYAPGHKGARSAHKVVHIFQLDEGSNHYVVEIDTPMDPLYQVYDEFTVSDSKTRPIGIFRSLFGSKP